MGVAAISEPVRRELYRFVTSSAEPVSREQAASGVDVPVHVARFHLDKLVDAGLLEVGFRRLGERPGRGGGRPSKLYRRSAREFEVSLPERHYDLLGRILANAAVESTHDGMPVVAAAARLARGEGRRHGEAFAASRPSGSDELTRLATALTDGGYEPRLEQGTLLLDNCPFHRVARDQPELVCGLNLEYVSGIVDGLGCRGLATALDPRPGHCCVSATARDA